MNNERKPLIILAGPTAVGKTDLSIRLAAAVNGEIISADSMQVYRHMNIGSAKIAQEEMKGIPHHLIDCYDPEEEFNVVEFQRAAKEAMEKVWANGHIPVVTGGTGFYIQALLRDIDFTETTGDPVYRAQLEERLRTEGAESLHAELALVDPESAEAIHANNIKRVIRALEFFRDTGEKISDHNKEEQARISPYNFLYLVLSRSREELYRRIEIRVDRMMEAGLVDEVRNLQSMGCHRGMISMQGLGYKEILEYLEGEIPLDEAVYKIKRDTRRFAKRQLTWFQREKDVTWIRMEEYDDEDAILEYILEQARKQGILLQEDNQMNQEVIRSMYMDCGISEEVYMLGEEVLKELAPRFEKIDQIAEVNQMKVLAAMRKNRVSSNHFAATTGYGYNDDGRDTMERVYADTFHTEDALVRSQITCGTHALHLALSANLRPGDELLSPVGKPYDTLEEVIGIRESVGSLAEYGVTYAQVDLLPDGGFDYEGIRKAINPRTKMATIQRSKGYASRPTLSPAQIGDLIAFLKQCKPDIICMVDNCYGEFVDVKEPSDYGADMIVGSLIKNPGGGLAPAGGYIAGTAECVERVARRLTSPGLGREVGANLGTNPSFYQGFFLAPTVTASAEKGAIFAAKLYERLGFRVHPAGDAERYDIIQAIDMKTAESMKAFCLGIQMAAPVDSFVTPIPWAMPGYDDEVIMAAGAFIQGASIELSADGPLRDPYTVYFQGGITWYHAKFGILMSLQKLVDAGFTL